MTLAPIEDVIRAAEQQAEIDWELEHRAPKPCEHDSVNTIRSYGNGWSRSFCADCGKQMP